MSVLRCCRRSCFGAAGGCAAALELEHQVKMIEISAAVLELVHKSLENSGASASAPRSRRYKSGNFIFR